MTSIKDEPSLGLATTRQLLDELRTRIEIDRYRGGGGLDYRTVDDESSDGAVIQLLFTGDTTDTDPALLKMLQVMGHTWGPLGVARSAVHLVWPEIPARDVLITIEQEPSQHE